MNSSPPSSNEWLSRRLSEAQGRARELEIACRGPVGGFLAGAYRSAFKGAGAEFEHVREYVPGDDVRLIDWKVTARTGRPHVRQHREERQLTVWVLADASASQEIGSASGEKFQANLFFCALLGFAASANRDRFGLALFTDRLEWAGRPAGGPGQVRAQLEAFCALERQGRGTDLGAALDRFEEENGRGDILFLVSDFQSPPFLEQLRQARRRRSVHAICVEHRLESALPAVGLLRIRDLERGGLCLIDTENAAVRARFAAATAQRSAVRRQVFADAGVELLECRTGEDQARALHEFLESIRRRAQSRHG